MQYRHVGKTGLKVSAVSIGGWLTFGASVAEDSARAILRQAIEMGVNFIDVADIYARGGAETVVGHVIRDVQRSDLVISSKVYWPMSENPNDRGLSRKHIFESVHKSLKRLGTDYLDIYFCHRFDEETPIEETVRAMDDLVRQGKVLYWGTSVWTAHQLKNAARLARDSGYYPPVVEQPRYNLMDRGIETEVLPEIAELGMGLVVWSPLAQGLLTGKYNEGVPAGSRGANTNWLSDKLTPQNLAKVRELGDAAAAHGMTSGQLALAWILHNPNVASVITGATRPEQLAENLRAAEITLDAGLAKQLDKLFPRI